MAQPEAIQLFKEMKKDKCNRSCLECGTASPEWASVNHGIMICFDCSGKHRNLGVHLSFVRSLSMDKWNPGQLALMKNGGNQKAREFFRSHNVPDDGGLNSKYSSHGARLYRRKLAALANDKPFDESVASREAEAERVALEQKQQEYEHQRQIQAQMAAAQPPASPANQWKDSATKVSQSVSSWMTNTWSTLSEKTSQGYASMRKSTASNPTPTPTPPYSNSSKVSTTRESPKPNQDSLTVSKEPVAPSASEGNEASEGPEASASPSPPPVITPVSSPSPPPVQPLRATPSRTSSRPSSSLNGRKSQGRRLGATRMPSPAPSL